MLSTVLEDTFAYYTVEEFANGFLKSLAFQACIIQQNRGLPGLCKVAMLNIGLEDTPACHRIVEFGRLHHQDGGHVHVPWLCAGATGIGLSRHALGQHQHYGVTTSTSTTSGLYCPPDVDGSS